MAFFDRLAALRGVAPRGVGLPFGGSFRAGGVVSHKWPPQRPLGPAGGRPVWAPGGQQFLPAGAVPVPKGQRFLQFMGPPPITLAQAQQMAGAIGPSGGAPQMTLGEAQALAAAQLAGSGVPSGVPSALFGYGTGLGYQPPAAGGGSQVARPEDYLRPGR